MLARLERLPRIFGRQAEALHLNGVIFATISWPAFSTTVWRKIMKNFTMRIVPILLAAAAVAHCGGDSTAPPGILVGTYEAVQFTTTTGSSAPVNQLAAGSTLHVQLAANGTVTGHLHIAASGSDPAFDEDMAGTWSKSGNTVTFTQAADTFVRNMNFSAVPNADVWDLTADQVFSGTRIQLTLSRLLPV
jgi:hypothetical protein